MTLIDNKKYALEVSEIDLVEKVVSFTPTNRKREVNAPLQATFAQTQHYAFRGLVALKIDILGVEYQYKEIIKL